MLKTWCYFTYTEYMNFLAHLHLSGDSEELKIGNFIGDFVKGKDLETYEPQIKKGIQLHRAIDLFTDNHPVVGKSKAILREKYRHYAGVIVDVYYDHFLASNWKRFDERPLEQYAQESYDLIQANFSRIPEKVHHLLFYMKRDDWLSNYKYVDGIRQALTGMSRRTRFDSKMDEAHIELVAHHSIFESHFLDFYTDLQGEVRRFLKEST